MSAVANYMKASRSSGKPFKSIAQIFKTLDNFYKYARVGQAIRSMPAGTLLPWKQSAGEAKFNVHAEYRKEQKKLRAQFKLKTAAYTAKGIPKPLKPQQLVDCQLQQGEPRYVAPFVSIAQMRTMLFLLYSSWHHRKSIQALPVDTLLPWKLGEGDEEAKYNAHEYYNRIKTSLSQAYGFAEYAPRAAGVPAFEGQEQKQQEQAEAEEKEQEHGAGGGGQAFGLGLDEYNANFDQDQEEKEQVQAHEMDEKHANPAIAPVAVSIASSESKRTNQINRVARIASLRSSSRKSGKSRRRRRTGVT